MLVIVMNVLKMVSVACAPERQNGNFWKVRVRLALFRKSDPWSRFAYSRTHFAPSRRRSLNTPGNSFALLLDVYYLDFKPIIGEGRSKKSEIA